MAKNKHTAYDLKQMLSLPLNIKVKMTERRIREWVEHFGEDGVYISFSGGKDSTVLLDIARKIYPNIKAMFVDTGLEYPEIRKHVQTFENVDIIRPKMGFRRVVEKYGFPLISKEVSECVYGARKYLTRLLEEKTILDRQTCRIRINSDSSQDKENIANFHKPLLISNLSEKNSLRVLGGAKTLLFL